MTGAATPRSTEGAGRHLPSFQFLAYRGLADLELAVQRIALRVPRDVDVVVGIPRSGILAASVLALQLNLPLTDLAGHLEGRLLGTGRRPRRRTAGAGRAIVVDDSVNTGQQMREARAQLAAAGAREGTVFAAAFVTGAARGAVDLYGEVVEHPRMFAWNILHHPELLARTCVDIDGVLCADPAGTDNDDGERYLRFVGDAQPLFLPTSPVGWVVTSRLERYRAQTEAWLREHEVAYGELVMLEGVTAEQRRAQGLHARHKADVYRRTGAELFVESDFAQAAEIAARSGRQVFAIDRREMLYPSPARALAAAPDDVLRSVARVPPVQALLHRSRRAAGRLAGPRLRAVARRALRQGRPGS